MYWTIPEIRLAPLKDVMGIHEILPTFFTGIFPRDFFGRKGREKFPTILIIPGTKSGIPIVLKTSEFLCLKTNFKSGNSKILD